MDLEKFLETFVKFGPLITKKDDKFERTMKKSGSLKWKVSTYERAVSESGGCSAAVINIVLDFLLCQ